MNFVKQILSSDTNQGSFSRVSGAVVVLALIVWATLIVVAKGAIPDIPVYWLTLVLGLYGINKSMEAAKIISATIKGGGDAATPQG